MNNKDEHRRRIVNFKPLTVDEQRILYFALLNSIDLMEHDPHKPFENGVLTMIEEMALYFDKDYEWMKNGLLEIADDNYMQYLFEKRKQAKENLKPKAKGDK